MCIWGRLKKEEETTLVYLKPPRLMLVALKSIVGSASSSKIGTLHRYRNWMT